MYIVPSGFHPTRTNVVPLATGGQRTMVVGRAIKSYGDDTGQVKNQEASTGLKRMVGVT
jgi:hypothetical protein